MKTWAPPVYVINAFEKRLGLALDADPSFPVSAYSKAKECLRDALKDAQKEFEAMETKNAD